MTKFNPIRQIFTSRPQHLLLCLCLLLFTGIGALAQQTDSKKSDVNIKYEREFRIRKEQFPARALESMEDHLKEVKRLRFYREIDSNRSSYEIKFKYVRLHYSVEFSSDGVLEDVEVRIKPVDIPADSWQTITEDLNRRFSKFRVRKIQQQYPREAFPSATETLKNAFQNLLLPQIRYELIVQARVDKGFLNYEILYDADGKFLNLRKSLPPNYDHVLY